jgi:hypothetical protein
MNEGADPLDPEDEFREDFGRLGAGAQIDHRRFFVSADYVRGKNENRDRSGQRPPSGWIVPPASQV